MREPGRPHPPGTDGAEQLSTVDTTERGRSPLSGLATPAVEALYQRLRAAGSVPADDLGPTGQWLLDLGIAFRSGEDDELVRPVAPAAALRILLDVRHRDLARLHRSLLNGWERLMSGELDAVEVAAVRNADGVRLLTDFDEIVAKAAELYASPKRRLRGVETGVFATKPSAARVRTPPAAVLAAGIRYQMIYEADFLKTAPGAAIVDESSRAGEQVRLRGGLPTKMLHVDDAVALVALTSHARSALLVSAPPLLAALAAWFDLMWDSPSTMRYGGDGPSPPLHDKQLLVLKLIAVTDDGTIARRLGMSVTTVRRHVRAIYEALEVGNRFAAGMAAAKRGWI
jgi:DNA-binding CsgD family transcriptional regulator